MGDCAHILGRFVGVFALSVSKCVLLESRAQRVNRLFAFAFRD